LVELSENSLALCLTLVLRTHELSEPTLCLGHIDSQLFTSGNDALHRSNMIVSFHDMLFDMSQQKQIFFSGIHGALLWPVRREHKLVSQPPTPGLKGRCR